MLELATGPSPDDLDQSLDEGFRYALSLTHDRSEAEDLVQDAVTTMLRKRASWDLPYLFATIRNRFIDSWRRKLKISLVPLERGAIFGRQAESAESFDCLEAALLHEALGTLRPDERETLFLAVVEGYTADEIGRLSGRPRGTVLSLLFRAKKKLREKLEPTYSMCGTSEA
ncbi:MAG: RNA polymerase sigma factor [Thermoanaerobaculia bacterium]